MAEEETQPLLEKKSSPNKKIRFWVVAGFILVAVLAFIAGALVGAYVWSDQVDSGSSRLAASALPKSMTEDADLSISQKILDGISADIRSNLQKLTANPHLSGTPADEQVLAGFVADTWKQQGLDYVTSMTYDVLLSYPDKDVPNQVYILDQNGEAIFSSAIKEDVLVPELDRPDIVQPYAAYSATGTVEGDLVYVNYGRPQDFKELIEDYNITVEGRIVIVRYGPIFRGDVTVLAERYKAKGLIVFSDPAETTDVNDPDNVFPQSWWLPPSGVQSGQYRSEKGDPLTPGFPSIASAYRVPEAKAVIPKIPIQPISYGDAKHFLEIMGGAEVPKDWRGGIRNTTYRFGPGFDQSHTEWKVKLAVQTSNRRVNTSNVIGVIKGSVEPDRYVILGNHRDAYVFGAVDPSSGTAVLLELTRVFANLLKEGWRPKRSLLFCSWGAEQLGLVGSFELVEEFTNVLGSRAVAYLNVDSAVNGNFYTPILGVPLLYEALYEAAQKVPTPNTPGKTIYDEWLATAPARDSDGRETGRPLVGRLRESTDEIPFVAECGVSSVNLGYKFDPNLNISDGPLFQTAYDLFRLVDQFNDPGFQHSRAIGQLWGEIARNIADSLLLPMNASTYARELHQYVQLLERDSAQLYEAVDGFIEGADDFHTRRDRINKQNPIEVRMFNDQLMHLERAFLDPQGIPEHPVYSRHVLYSPMLFEWDSGSSFPGLVDLLYDIDRSPDPEGQWEKVKRHLATIIFAVKSATSTLQEVGMLSQ